jgi:hypothetical protein
VISASTTLLPRGRREASRWIVWRRAGSFGGGVVEDCGSDDCRSGYSDDTGGECDGKRELWNVPAPHAIVADGGPKDLARDPRNTLLRVMHG